MIRISDLVLPLDTEDESAYLKKQAAKRLKIRTSDILELKISKKAVDARKKEAVVFRCNADVTVPDQERVLQRVRDSKIRETESFSFHIPVCGKAEHRPVVVGFGPAGMFAALLLAQAGQCPVVIERGSCVEDRMRRVRLFWTDRILDTECNVQFGEGGAGTFSDGKLNTGTRDPRSRKVLEELSAAGGGEEILIQAHPHIGTDRLPETVRNIRRQIESLGGTVRFDTRLEQILQKDHAVCGVRIRHGGAEEILDTDRVVLAIGHSARDTYEYLAGAGFVMEQKAFSMGVRIEHLQTRIDRAQYGTFAGHPKLGAAEYRLAVHLKDGRGVYTFCMCPGGQVVAAASETGRVVTNGMSSSKRDGSNANAALLVGVTPEDFPGGHVLAGMQMQRDLEEKAFRYAGGSYRAPVQRVGDFLEKRKTTAFGEVIPTYSAGVEPGDLHEVLPPFIAQSLHEGILQMDRRLSGFACPDAVMTGVETRSSAPVRILRDRQLQSVGCAGLYPCGEGAGYAGGIVSAAVDGLRCAEQILRETAGEQP